jgi:hypothetical protein
LLFSSIAAANSEGSSEVTNWTAIPYFLRNTVPKICQRHTRRVEYYLPLNWLYV